MSKLESTLEVVACLTFLSLVVYVFVSLGLAGY